jgi:oxygen-independent coproporphyrinogen-3 oxidase
VLIGLGASSISRFPQGYAQNIPATAAYTAAVRDGRLATHRGHRFAGEDLLRARIIEALMCDFTVRYDELAARFGQGAAARAAELCREAAGRFGTMVRLTGEGLSIPPEGRPLTRVVARAFDAYDMAETAHSSAI